MGRWADGRLMGDAAMRRWAMGWGSWLMADDDKTP